MVGVIVVSVGRWRGWRTAAFDTDYTYAAAGASAESDELQIFGGEPQFLALNCVCAHTALG